MNVQNEVHQKPVSVTLIKIQIYSSAHGFFMTSLNYQGGVSAYIAVSVQNTSTANSIFKSSEENELNYIL